MNNPRDRMKRQFNHVLIITVKKGVRNVKEQE
jgi:hypothetical protein